MDLLAEIGSYFAQAFAWVGSALTSLWTTAMQTAFLQGVANALGQGTAKLLLAAALILVTAVILNVAGLLSPTTYKFFVAVALVFLAFVIISAIAAGQYWLAFQVALLAVLVLAACATVDPNLIPTVLEVMGDAFSVLGAVVSSIASGTGSLLGGLLGPALLLIGGYYLLTQDNEPRSSNV